MRAQERFHFLENFPVTNNILHCTINDFTKDDFLTSKLCFFGILSRRIECNILMSYLESVEKSRFSSVNAPVVVKDNAAISIKTLVKCGKDIS